MINDFEYVIVQGPIGVRQRWNTMEVQRWCNDQKVLYLDSVALWNRRDSVEIKLKLLRMGQVVSSVVVPWPRPDNVSPVVPRMRVEDVSPVVVSEGPSESTEDLYPDLGHEAHSQYVLPEVDTLRWFTDTAYANTPSSTWWRWT